MIDDSSQAKRLREKLDQGARQLAIPLSDHQSDLLVQFLGLLDKWNRVYNLTAVRSIDEMVGRHLLDSLTVMKWLPSIDSAQQVSGDISMTTDVLDVGSGGGLPVIALAIARPNLTFVSVESSGKKTRFQQQVVMELGLGNVQVLQMRVEDTNVKAKTVVSRAFAAPEKFITAIDKNCLPDTRVILMLGQKERISEPLPCSFSVSELVEVDVPYCEATRHIAICSRSS